MRVLVGCESSGVVRNAFRARGCDAWSCDLLPADDNSGVCHLYTDAERWLKLFDAADFFLKLLNAPIPKICVENPIMRGYAKEYIGGLKQSQVIQPWMFGHMEQKVTCLWLKSLPLLVAENNVKNEMLLLPKNERERLHYLSPSPDRWKERSRTFEGVAEAMANHWLT